METRSRKRVEATTHRPSTATPACASKRQRHSVAAADVSITGAFSASGAGTPLNRPPRTRPSTRTYTAAAAAASTGQFSEKGMETGAEAVPSCSRRAREKSSSRSESDRAFVHPLHKDEEERGIAEKLERDMEKGKEKETEKENDRVRERSERLEVAERVERTERVEGDKAVSSGDDENDGDGGGHFNQNLASASSALHGLLRKLGAGLDDLMPLSAPSSHQSSKLKRILSGLRAEGEDKRQLEALSQLCELLSIGTEESLSSFSVDSFVPLLVGLLNYEFSPDIMLLAARALTHLCDVLPSSCAAVVHYGAVPCFCARLLTIEYIDLAEQSLQALEKISHEHPVACLRAGALMAVLSYLDFFSTGVQRVAVTTAANMCRQLPSDAADFVTEAVPLLTNLLQYQDSKVVDHASVCLSRIAETFGSSSEKLDMLCAHGLIPQVARLISVSNSSTSLVPQASLSSSTYTELIRLLSTCASGSAGAAESLLMLRLSSILKEVLAGSGLMSSISGSGSSVNRPPEQLYEIVTLVNELLPSLPDGHRGAVGSSSSGSSESRGGRKQSGLAIASKTDECVGGVSRGSSAREKLLREQPELLEQFGNDLFPVLVQVYGSSVNPSLRHNCLVAINKLVHLSTPDMLRLLLHESNISSFLAGVLGSKDMSLLRMALQIAEMLMQKLPDLFMKMFVKEGVVHALDTLIASEGIGAGSPLPAGRSGELAANVVVMASGGVLPPPRPRRGGASRRQSLGSAEEGGLLTSAPAGTVASPTLAEPLRAIRSGLRASAILQAKKIRGTYFHVDAGSSNEGVTESLRKLKCLSAQLRGESGVAAAEVKGKGKSKARGGGVGSGVAALSDEQLGLVVGEMLSELAAGDGVSTFEFVGSGVVGSLIHYFSCGNTSKERVDDRGLREQVVKRLNQFIEMALPGEGKNGTGSRHEVPLTLLVRKLQNAMASLERFPVVLSHTPRSSSGSASMAAGLSALTQPFKLRLCRATGDKMLRDYSTNIVLIEPLATLVAVEDFLWPRVKRQESVAVSGASALEESAPIAVPSAERRSTRSRSSVGAVGAGSSWSSGLGRYAISDSGNAGASGAKGKGKAVSRSLGPLGPCSNGEDFLGPETRNAAARKRAAASAASASAAAQALSEEESEEDVEVSPVELEEARAMDEDDHSEEEDEDELEDDHDDVYGDEPVSSCKGDRVHEVEVGDAEGSGVASPSEASQPSAAVSVVTRTGVIAPGAAENSGIRTWRTRGSLSYAAAAFANAGEIGSPFCGRERKSLAVVAATNSTPKLVFSLRGKPLCRTLTIFQAIQCQGVTEDGEDERCAGSEHLSGDGRRLWDEVYTITYERAEIGGCGGSNAGAVNPQGKGCSQAMERSWQQTCLVDSTLVRELPCDLDRSNNTYEILVLLRVLEGLNRLAPRLRAQSVAEAFARGDVDRLSESPAAGPVVPREEFLSSKLTPKLARQMQDALALCSGGLPSWCGQLTRACPFLFPFETRRQYFHSTAFGLSRALQRLQTQQSAEGGGSTSEQRELRVGRLQRQKVRVSRQRILESAAKVMELYAGHKAVLEVEYFGEVGTGLGPTLEFYTLLSHELQKEKLEIWRTELSLRSEVGVDVEMAEVRGPEAGPSLGGELQVALSSGEYVNAPQGLFPRPWHPETDVASNKKYGKVLECFRLLGRVMAKALQDCRLLDMPLSTLFYKIVLGQESGGVDLDLYDIETLDPVLGRTLFEMQVIVQRKQFLEVSGQFGNGLRFRGSRVEDLCLDFTLPGYPEYELKSQGRNVTVELDNLEEYISLVVEATVKSGIRAQIEAFRSGFNQVFQLSSLQIFTEDELEYLLCGRRELWAPESLPDIMKFDHGYTASSPPIRNLLDIMSELTLDEQRAFLRFVTGAPRLPPGGLAALNPKLTIVRKHPTGGTGTALGTTPPGTLAGMGTTLADRDLPSVMTCANYLKLPPYSCKEMMKERLLYAIHEGQGSFDLS